jgi:hypothetical protein
MIRVTYCVGDRFGELHAATIGGAVDELHARAAHAEVAGLPFTFTLTGIPDARDTAEDLAEREARAAHREEKR